jgi:hypothetical protein
MTRALCWMAWATLGLSMVGAGLLALLGASYLTDGSGIHPVLAVAGAGLCLGCGWGAAVVADWAEGRA